MASPDGLVPARVAKLCRAPLAGSAAQVPKAYAKRMPQWHRSEHCAALASITFGALIVGAPVVACTRGRRTAPSSKSYRLVRFCSTNLATASIWTLLDLPPGASKVEIKRRFKSFVRSEHPDVKGAGDAEAASKFARVMEAYREIMDTDEDRFWLEAYCAKVESIEARRGAAWKRKRDDRFTGFKAAQAREAQARAPTTNVGDAARSPKKPAQVSQDDLVKVVGFFIGLVLVLILLSSAVGNSAKSAGTVTRGAEARRLLCTSWDTDFCADLP